jgi:CubicO group peptidase (beta-lactamase class C family)
VTDIPVEFKPGEKFTYNNTGYYLLGMIIEKTSGKKYGEFLDERLFKPLGMTSTRVNDLREVIKHRAQGYSIAAGRLVNGDYVSPTQPFSAGALVSTVNDMAKWDAALYSESPLRRAARDKMWTEAKLNDGKGAGYGFGWSVGNRNGRKLVEHGGGIQGFSTQISRFLDDKLTVIVLTNSDNGRAGAIANGIASIYVPELKIAVAAPIEDKDSATTLMLRKSVETLLSGSKEGIPLTPSFSAFLTPERLQLGPNLVASAGKLTTFQLLRSRAEGKNTVYQYRAMLGRTAHLMTFVLTESKLIEGASIQPE